MNSRWLPAVLVVVVAGFGVILWRQQQVINKLSAPGGGVQSPIPSANNIDIPKPTPALSNVDFRVPVAGAPSRGDNATDVVFIEYSDFQCPYCARYVRDVLPRLQQEYIDTGKARYVFKQFPLEGIHPNAMGAAVVASCAVAPGKFWDLHDAFFENQDALDMPSLMGTAARFGLADPSFKACVDQQSPLGAINASRQEAVAAGFTGTPGFLVGRLGPDGTVHATRRLYGANPYSLFQSAINDVLASK